MHIQEKLPHECMNRHRHRSERLLWCIFERVNEISVCKQKKGQRKGATCSRQALCSCWRFKDVALYATEGPDKPVRGALEGCIDSIFQPERSGSVYSAQSEWVRTYCSAFRFASTPEPSSSLIAISLSTAFIRAYDKRSLKIIPLPPPLHSLCYQLHQHYTVSPALCSGVTLRNAAWNDANETHSDAHERKIISPARLE